VARDSVGGVRPKLGLRRYSLFLGDRFARKERKQDESQSKDSRWKTSKQSQHNHPNQRGTLPP
jgi:hypothetical protein